MVQTLYLHYPCDPSPALTHYEQPKASIYVATALSKVRRRP
jgi:hypothetical protein